MTILRIAAFILASALAVSTAHAGIKTQWLEYSHGDTKLKAYVAYDDAAQRTPASTVTGDLGGSNLKAGVYRSGSSLGLTGTLTLDAEGDPNAVFIFLVSSALTTTPGTGANHGTAPQP